jgi:hypothetical protein
MTSKILIDTNVRLELVKDKNEVGLDNLGPWDNFEWGMLNGKLSAVRWVSGDDWDMLNT